MVFQSSFLGGFWILLGFWVNEFLGSGGFLLFLGEFRSSLGKFLGLGGFLLWISELLGSGGFLLFLGEFWSSLGKFLGLGGFLLWVDEFWRRRRPSSSLPR